MGRKDGGGDVAVDNRFNGCGFWRLGVVRIFCELRRCRVCPRFCAGAGGGGMRQISELIIIAIPGLLFFSMIFLEAHDQFKFLSLRKERKNG